MHLNRNVNFIVNFIMLSITLAFVLLEIWPTVLHFWNHKYSDLLSFEYTLMYTLFVLIYGAKLPPLYFLQTNVSYVSQFLPLPVKKQ